MSHAIDPFRQPALADSEDDAPASAAAAPSSLRYRRPIHAASTSGAASTSSPLKFFRNVFPDARSQVAFVIALAAALAGSIYWLVYTIRDKWQFDIDHPQQSVRFSLASTLPAFFGLSLVYFDSSYGDSAMLYRGTTFHFSNVAPLASWDNAYMRCEEVVFYYNTTLCVPTDADGRPFFPAAGLTSEVAGDIADPAVWPLQFRGQQDHACIGSHMLLNKTLMTQPTFVEPTFGFVALTAAEVSSTLRHIADGQNGATAQVLSFLNSVHTPLLFSYQQYHLLQFTATRQIQVDGSSALEYLFGQTQHLQVSDAFLQQQYEGILNDTAPGGSLENARDYALLSSLRNDSEVAYKTQLICFVPSTFLVQEIRQVRTYTITNFLSDVGGFLNLVTVALLFLFPFAYKATEARSFIVIWLVHKARTRRLEIQARELDAHKKQMEMEAEMTSASSQQPPQSSSEASHITPNPAVSAEM